MYSCVFSADVGTTTTEAIPRSIEGEEAVEAEETKAVAEAEVDEVQAQAEESSAEEVEREEV